MSEEVQALERVLKGWSDLPVTKGVCKMFSCSCLYQASVIIIGHHALEQTTQFLT